MAYNLTAQVRNIAEVDSAIANGDLSKKITVTEREILELKNTINTMVDQLVTSLPRSRALRREVGSEGNLGGQANVLGVCGHLERPDRSVNSMAGNLTNQVRNIADVSTAVANGDLSTKNYSRCERRNSSTEKTINVIVDQLNSFAAEVTRVANEVGTEGKLGGQAEVKGVSGTWKDLTRLMSIRSCL